MGEGAETYGVPSPTEGKTHPNMPGTGYAEPARVRGSGYDYTFADLEETSIAFNKTAKQSTTEYGGVALRAVDVTNGHYAKLSRTARRRPTAPRMTLTLARGGRWTLAHRCRWARFAPGSHRSRMWMRCSL